MITIEWLDKPIDDRVSAVMNGHPRTPGDKALPFDLPDDTGNYLCFQENDYLRLSKHPSVIEAQARTAAKSGIGKLSSSTYAGKNTEHEKFCRLLAESMKSEAAILTTSGWAANVGLVDAITPRDKCVYVDIKAHSTLWDGARLSQRQIIPVAHNNVDYLARKVRRHGPGVVLLDAFYSTDGDVANLKAYVDACEELNCAIVLDEAHSFGLIGENGGGLAVELGLHDRISFRTGSLSKALGGFGGFIAGRETSMYFMRFTCHSLVFSSSTSEIIAAGNRAALEIVMENPAIGRRCLEMAAILRDELTKRRIDVSPSKCQIVSLEFFGRYSASRVYWALRDRGILASVFSPPATPVTKSLLRFSIHVKATREQMIETAKATMECIDATGMREQLVRKWKDDSEDNKYPDGNVLTVSDVSRLSETDKASGLRLSVDCNKAVVLS